jgi:hypothetical protein
LEELSKLSSDDAAAYTIKLSDSMLERIRLFGINGFNGQQ